ncbi:MAG: tetratricopeptide repeat protein [Bacteroidales bacterium]|nr:tetratricopeptide repeat protein [Bacteroidales bacterium]
MKMQTLNNLLEYLKYLIKNYVLTIGLGGLLLLNLVDTANGQQPEKKYVRKGNSAYEKKNYNEAEILYRKALEKHDNFSVAQYNLGNALYRQSKFEEAVAAYQKAIGSGGLSKNDLPKAYHNLGNSLLQTKKIAESIEAYKQALRLNPRDLETKYNLALAQKLLKNPPQQNQQNQPNQQNNQGQNQNQKNNQNQDQNQNNQNNNQSNQQNNDQQGNQPQGARMTKEQANQLLEAIQNDENNTQDKVKKEQAKGARVRPDKDW